MRRFVIYLFTGLVALICGIAGYTISAHDLPFLGQAEARSDTMPTNPRIVYLSNKDNPPNTIIDTKFNEHEVAHVNSWQAARQAARERPLDALIIDATMLQARDDADTIWLRSQLDDGVTVVGIGVPDDELAAAIGVKTFQAPEETKRERGATGYRLVQAFILAEPEDLKILRDFGWIDVQISGSTQQPDSIKSPWRGSFSSAQGQLDTPEALTLFFQRLEERIKGAYEMRAEYQEQLKQKGTR